MRDNDSAQPSRPDGSPNLPPQGQSAKKHLRGSSLMLAGKMVALLINLATQTVIVRALTKDDYGSFAYVLSLLMLGASITKLSMDKALSRFVPIYFERGDLSRTAGVISFVFFSNLLVGGLLVAATLLFAPQFFQDGKSLQLLMFLVVLAPIEALETGFQKLLAIMANPRSLMFRRHMLGPILKLGAALPLLWWDADVFLLGYCYLGARVLGTLVSFGMARHELTKAGVWTHLASGTRETRELLSFSLPLTTLDVSFALRTSLVTLLLEFFHGVIVLAVYRAVVPLSRLNLVVSDSFRMLFTPALARLHAREDHRQIEDLYWSNAAWIALLTYPVFVVTFLFAEPLTVLLFEARYRDAAPILSMLALATYVNACFGFNSVTLQTLGKVRIVVTNGLLSAVASAGFLFWLIPEHGAMGGAVAVTLGQLVENSLNQLSLYRVGSVRFMAMKYTRVYLYLILATVLIATVDALSPFLWATAPVAACVGLCVLRLSARSLDAESIFPEVRRFALLRIVLGLRGGRDGAASKQLVSVAVIESMLSERGEGYFPEMKSKLDSVALIQQQLRSNSEVYEFELQFADHCRRVIVKAPYTRRTVSMVRRALVQDRPRVTPRTDIETKGKHEFLALRAIDQHFSQLPDLPFGVVRMFDMLPDASGGSSPENSKVLVMEKGPSHNLSDYLKRFNRLQLSQRGQRRPTFPIGESFRATGSWLREFHGIQPPEHCETRCERRQDFLENCELFWAFLADRHPRRASELAAMRSQFADACQKLPDYLPLGVVHGDYAPRNVLVDDQGKITGFDTQARWQAPIFEDIGHFLVASKASGLQVGTRGLAYSKKLLLEFEAEFLAGYFGDSPPMHCIRLFECQRLLEWWSSLLYVHEQARGWRKWPKYARAALWQGPIVSYLKHALNEATAAGATPLPSLPQNAPAHPY